MASPPLSQDNQILAWQQLRDCKGWELLVDAIQAQIAIIPAITDLNSKEAFIYESIRAQALQAVIKMPDEIIKDIERGKHRHPVGWEVPPPHGANI